MKKFTSPILFGALLLFVTSVYAIPPIHFSGGSGTVDDPYKIANLNDLSDLSVDNTFWDKYFIQTADIDASETSSWNSGEGFSPIGTDGSHPFSGSYDGDGHIISGLYIHRNANMQGLFGYVLSGTVENLGVTQVNITSSLNNVGGLVGYNIGTVKNCYSTGSVNGGMYVGGLAGQNGINADPLVYGTISDSYSAVSVNGNDFVGGLVGMNSYNSGDLKITVSNCYSTGSVSGLDYVGGLVGGNSGTVSNSYSTGSVPVNINNKGGLVGFNNGGIVSNSFWDTQTSGITAVGNSSGVGTGKTTAEMTDYSTFKNAGWDFVTIWAIGPSYNGGYPNLDGQGRSTITWNGSVSTDWNAATNWVGGAIPIGVKDVVIPAGSDHYPALTADVACNDLTIESGAASSGSLTGQINLMVNGTVTIERYLTGNKWHIVSSPAPGQTIVSFLSANTAIPTDGSSQRGMMEYLEATNDWSTFFTNVKTGNLTDGEGFSVRTNVDSVVAFSGTLATGNVSVTLSKTAGTGYGWNCVGNPYPSAIYATDNVEAVNNLLTVNTNSLEESHVALYVWDEQADYDGSRNDYKIINLSGGTLDQDYIQVGQGFMVKAASNGATFSFTTAMQTNQPAISFKSGTVSDWKTLVLTATNGTETGSTTVKFNDAMTDGLDVGYDAGVFKTGFDIYTKLVDDNGVDFGLQCLPLSEIKELEIPVGMDASEGDVTFSIQTENMPGDVVPVLNDKVTGAQFAFKNNNVTYKATLNGNTGGYGRFSLSFTSVTGIDQIGQPKYRVWYSNGEIYITGQTTDKAQVEVYDVNGRKRIARQLTPSGQNRLKAPAGAPGVYLVKVQGAGYNNVFKIVKPEN